MIILLAASALYMSGLQAGIAEPTSAFRNCLREAASKARSEKVTSDKIEAYLKTACTPQMSSLSEALIAFRMKNGMTRKAASSDASMTVDDYVSTPADNYKFLVSEEAKQAPPSAPAAAAPAAAVPVSKPAVMTPASATTPSSGQPPKH